MAEGSDALLEQLGCQDAGTRGPWSAHGCQVSEPNSTLAWARDVLSGGTRYATELAVLLGLTNTRDEGDWWRHSRCSGTAGGFSGRFFRLAVGLIRCILLDRPHNQNAAKAARSAMTEPTKLDWMRMMRLAKFLVTHDELEWLYHAQYVPEKYVVHGDSDSAGSETRRSTSGTLNSLDSIPLNSAARLSTLLLSRAERLSCTPRRAAA